MPGDRRHQRVASRCTGRRGRSAAPSPSSSVHVARVGSSASTARRSAPRCRGPRTTRPGAAGASSRVVSPGEQRARARRGRRAGAARRRRASAATSGSRSRMRLADRLAGDAAADDEDPAHAPARYGGSRRPSTAIVSKIRRRFSTPGRSLYGPVQISFGAWLAHASNWTSARSPRPSPTPRSSARRWRASLADLGVAKPTLYRMAGTPRGADRLSIDAEAERLLEQIHRGGPPGFFPSRASSPAGFVLLFGDRYPEARQAVRRVENRLARRQLGSRRDGRRAARASVAGIARRAMEDGVARRT